MSHSPRSTSSPFGTLVDRSLEAGVIGSFTRIGPSIRSRTAHWVAPKPTPGRVVVVTGASSGLGKEAALELAALECHVIIVGRNQARLDAVAANITASGGSVAIEQADLADLNQTVALADRLSSSYDAIDVLINNAGALLASHTTTPQGFETTLAVHLLSPFVLTTRLASVMEQADQSKVITMTSGGMYSEAFDLAHLEMDPTSYKGSVAYARAKRAQVVLNLAWQTHELPHHRTFCAVHPGWTATPGISESLPIFQKVMGPLLRSPKQGVDTLMWLATQAPGEPQGGQLWLDREPRSLYRLKKTRVNEHTLARQGEDLLAYLAHVTSSYLG